MERYAKKLFEENYKECTICHMELPADYPEEMCPMCMERELFNMVKEYIRENDVNEHQVADHFQIPLSRIRGWIRDGRIEYKEMDNTIEGLHCKRCGKVIFSGYFCPQCARFMSGNRGHGMAMTEDDEKLRFINHK